jgi:hypothetical protein
MMQAVRVNSRIQDRGQPRHRVWLRMSPPAQPVAKEPPRVTALPNGRRSRPATAKVV